MTLGRAKGLILGGERFGGVYEELETESDRAALKDWFVREPSVPVDTPRNMDQRRADRPPRTLVLNSAAPLPTGDPCPTCGGLMVQTGKCKTCQFCGTGEGACS